MGHVALSRDMDLRQQLQQTLGATYALDRELGGGGMSRVFVADERRLNRKVVIKVLSPELAAGVSAERFDREIQLAASLQQANIVPILAAGETDGLPFYTMPFVEGESLRARLIKDGPLPIATVISVLRDVAKALAYAHERSVVHRDIKPDNVLLSGGTAVVTDFGIAKAISAARTEVAGSTLTQLGTSIGTPSYMSPEQAAGDRQIDGRSDLYSLGVVAYQMLVGEPPFVANSTPAMLVKHISEVPTPVTQRRSDVPPDLARAVMLCLEKDPVMRFPSAGALVTALDTGQVPELRHEPAVAPKPVQATMLPPDYALDEDDRLPTTEEMRRWKDKDVVKFRKKLAPYLFVNAVIVIASIFGERDFLGITVIWSIYMAFKYARLWSEGYDWRDVFKQRRDKELIDVADEFLEYVRALFNRDKRRELRERNRARNFARRSSGALMLDAGTGDVAVAGGFRDSAAGMEASGPNADKVRQAAIDRDEIVRLVGSLPDKERAQVVNVTRSAHVLYDRIHALAIAASDLERNVVAGGGATLEAEIDRLEDQANPLERGSEERVRRLAYLKRQRRAVKDVQDRRDAATAKLETCSLALRQLKLDVLRLRAGSQTHQRVTSLALEAIALAENVDSALYVADEVARATDRSSHSSLRSSARPG